MTLSDGMLVEIVGSERLDGYPEAAAIASELLHLRAAARKRSREDVVAGVVRGVMAGVITGVSGHILHAICSELIASVGSARASELREP